MSKQIIFIPAKKCKKCGVEMKIFSVYVEEKTGQCVKCFFNYKTK